MSERKCLVIEDQISVQRLLDDMAISLGYEPINASNNLEGLIYFEQHRASLVLADAETAGKISTSELAATIKRLAPETVVVLVSGQSVTAQEEKASPADAVLHKPFSLGSLQSALNEYRHN